MKTLHTIMTAVLLAGSAALITGCGKKTESESAVPAPETSTELTGVFQAVAQTENLKPIPDLRSEVSTGDEVVIEAKVMGVEEPFVEGRALFVVGDEATITSCDLMSEDDHCETPWDACCEDSDALRAGTATIQIVDADGRVLRSGIRGVNGLTELSRVRVAGTVAEQSSADNLIINATAIEIL